MAEETLKAIKALTSVPPDVATKAAQRVLGYIDGYSEAMNDKGKGAQSDGKKADESKGSQC